jgi:hypothetical protein
VGFLCELCQWFEITLFSQVFIVRPKSILLNQFFSARFLCAFCGLCGKPLASFVFLCDLCGEGLGVLHVFSVSPYHYVLKLSQATRIFSRLPSAAPQGRLLKGDLALFAFLSRR